MNLVLDTCAVLWYTLAPDSLTLKAHKTIAKAEHLVVSSISVWEIGIKCIRTKLELGTTLEDYVSRLTRSDSIEIVDVDCDLWVQSVLLPWQHRDPADRVIVSLAQRLDLPIVTDDEEIQRFYKRTVQ